MPPQQSQRLTNVVHYRLYFSAHNFSYSKPMFDESRFSLVAKWSVVAETQYNPLVPVDAWPVRGL